MYIVRYIFFLGGGSHAYIFHSFGLLCKSNNFANPVERGLGGWNPTHAWMHPLLDSLMRHVQSYITFVYTMYNTCIIHIYICIYMFHVRLNLLNLSRSLFPNRRLLSVCHHQLHATLTSYKAVIPSCTPGKTNTQYLHRLLSVKI